jgi:hypothetical protein
MSGIEMAVRHVEHICDTVFSGAGGGTSVSIGLDDACGRTDCQTGIAVVSFDCAVNARSRREIRRRSPRRRSLPI